MSDSGPPVGDNEFVVGSAPAYGGAGLEVDAMVGAAYGIAVFEDAGFADAYGLPPIEDAGPTQDADATSTTLADAAYGGSPFED